MKFYILLKNSLLFFLCLSIHFYQDLTLCDIKWNTGIEVRQKTQKQEQTIILTIKSMKYYKPYFFKLFRK